MPPLICCTPDDVRRSPSHRLQCSTDLPGRQFLPIAHVGSHVCLDDSPKRLRQLRRKLRAARLASGCRISPKRSSDEATLVPGGGEDENQVDTLANWLQKGTGTTAVSQASRVQDTVQLTLFSVRFRRATQPSGRARSARGFGGPSPVKSGEVA